MNDAVILSHSLVMSRYAGPYVAANSARKAGYQVKVLDYFLHHDNIEEYIKPHVGPNTKLLAIAVHSYTEILKIGILGITF